MITLGGDAELELVDSLDPFSEGIVFRSGAPSRPRPPTPHPFWLRTAQAHGRNRQAASGGAETGVVGRRARGRGNGKRVGAAVLRSWVGSRMGGGGGGGGDASPPSPRRRLLDGPATFYLTDSLRACVRARWGAQRAPAQEVVEEHLQPLGRGEDALIPVPRLRAPPLQSATPRPAPPRRIQHRNRHHPAHRSCRLGWLGVYWIIRGLRLESGGGGDCGGELPPYAGGLCAFVRVVWAWASVQPTPLYVMDEIDAALDFKNVSIVANYIKERCVARHPPVDNLDSCGSDL